MASNNNAAYDDPLPIGLYAPLVVFQMLFSAMSILGSCVVIRIASPKLGSTYQRFLFVWSIAIVVNSVFLCLHPLLVPTTTTKESSSSSITPWAVGNDQTCSMVGFFWVFGALLVSFYHNALTLYFQCSIRDDNDDDDDDEEVDDDNNAAKGGDTSKRRRARRRRNNNKPREPEDVVGAAEMMVNVVCWLIPAAVAGTGAAMNAYGFDAKVDMCVLYEACDIDEDDNCVPINYDSVSRYGTSTSVALRNTFHWILVASAALSVLVMATLQFQVRRATKRSQRIAQKRAGDEMDLEAADEQQQIIQKLNAVSTQCVLYTLSYLNSYVWFIALIFIPANSVNLLYAFQFVASIFYPSLGVFNCLIYVRPRVQMLQIMYPQDPFVVVLRVAMSKAGDPGEIEMVREIIYGSEYSGSAAAGAHDNDDGEGGDHSEGGESRDSAIPSVVHFDSEQKPLSIKSLVSAPGEGDDNDDPNHSLNHSASLLSPLGDPDDSLG